jgi:hypothetical protein
MFYHVKRKIIYMTSRFNTWNIHHICCDNIGYAYMNGMKCRACSVANSTEFTLLLLLKRYPSLIMFLLVVGWDWVPWCLACIWPIVPATNKQTNKQTPWSESASEPYRPSDRRLSAKWLPTFVDKGCHVVSVTDPYGRILGFLDRSRYFFIK